MGSYEEFYANIRCMFRLQNMYCCSCALQGSSNTTAFAFYIESPFFVEIIIIFILFSQYRKVIGTILHDHVHAAILADREESWLQWWTPVNQSNSHAPSTGSPSQTESQVGCLVNTSLLHPSFAGFHIVQYSKWCKWMPRWSCWVDAFQVAQTTSNSPIC